MAQTRILIAEGEPQVARDLQRQLSELGYEPLADTALAESAVQLAEEQRPDLVLMDIHLEGEMDGIAAAQIIRDRLDLPVVFLAAFTDEETLDRVKRSEPFGYILKPVEKRELQIVIEIALYKHRAENLLRRGREEQAAILRTTLDGYWLVDDQGRILDLNEVCCQMHGYRREEMLGKHLTDFEADESAGEIAAVVDRIQQSGSARFERRHRCKDGRLIDVELSTTFLPGGSGHFSTFLRDITERKRTEQALRENEDRYRDLVDNSKELVSTYDLDGNFLTVNETTVRVTGYSRESLLKMNLADLVVPEFRHLVPQYLKSIQADGHTSGIMRIQTASGERRTWEHNTTLRTEGVAVPVVRGMAMDITDRLRSEKALRASEAQLRVILESTNDGILAVDREGKVLKTNQRFADLWQIPPALIAGGDDQAMLNHVLSQLSEPDAFLHKVQALYASDTTGLDEIHFKDGRSFERFSAPMLEGSAVTGRVWSFRDITERKRTEAALRENEDRYRDLLDNSQQIISTCDLAGNLLSVNETAVRISGYTSDVLLKMNLADLIAPEVRHRFQEYLETIVRDGRARGTMRILTATGERRYWEFETSMRTEGVATPIVRGMALDITDRFRAEKELRASHERFELANRASFDIIWDWDLKTRAIWRNDNFQTLFGYSADERETSFDLSTSLVHPDDLARVRAGIQAALDARSEHWADRYRFRRKDGSYATVEDRAIITWDASGNAGRMLGAMQDISERERAEARLRLQSGALEAAANAIVITNRLGVIEWANPAFTTFTGYSQGEAIGKRPGDLLRSGTHDRAFYKGMWDAILGGNVWQGEVINRRKDGSLYTEEMTITPLRDPSGELTHFVAVKQDVTQRKVLEQSFRQSQKLEAVGRLAGGVAHDFNNMLGVILGYVEVALDQVDPSQALHADLLEIQKAAGRSTALTRQLLAFARQEAIAPRVLDLNETVAGMLTMLRRLIGESIEVSWQPAATVWPIEMDPSQIDQIVANLCVNARDAIAGVGRIALATANCAIDAEFCANNVDAVAGDFVRLTVSDSGGGMDTEMLTRIFEPFFTTKGVGEGTGLGLSMVYGAVKQNRGFLVVRSTPGQGTAFEIYLPRHVGQAEPVRKVSVAAPAQRGQETILLVEDEPAILRLTTRALEAQGYAVLAASSPSAALLRAREHADAIHLLLTDVVMPEMNGRELAKRLMSLHPRLKCVFMSGYTADVIAKGGVLEEGVHFLQKPFAIADLAATVRRVLDRE